MELKKILVGLEGLKVKGDLEIKITGIESDSKKIKKGNMFVAIKGYTTDGHIYIEDAIESGATAVMVEAGCDTKILKNIKEEITIVMVPDTRKALAQVSINYYNNPSSKFKLIGVTGTKGKTTTTFMIKEILEKVGKKVGLIGTISTYINGKKIADSDRTTPESIELQKIFAQMVKEEVEYVVMEVSSQSLKLHRVDGSEFDVVVFTNLSEDHISEKEHTDMKEYFESKMELFKMCKNGITNADDLYGAKVQRMFPDNKIETYGIDNFAELMARDITVTSSYADFKVKLNGKNERVKVGIPGRFSIYNALSAIAVVQKFGIDTETIKTALLEVRVPGRSEIVDNKMELPIMIDYAHSPESLENILQALKSYVRGRVICVFGCGGDRDKRKRPVMGEISGRLADYTIITTDNQRSEKPEDIIAEIEEGIKKTKGNYKTVVDRREAIKEAIKMASKSDMIILAGKGHEVEQEINGKKYPFDERIIVREIIEELENESNKKGKKQKDERK
ncbi:MAG: UDP-N-acetylmuramoyl-L-alanyl-D-glutamate--2,6-diaminopimelate ligase [Clostridia bacterium]|nr:UDP-N-acetylmuramoyl-L-alanyl-D-glutamate--2,6-diaminopimelate ligase [Clostridia bacterium]